MAACQRRVEHALPLSIASDAVEAIECLLESTLAGESRASANEVTQMFVFSESDLNLRDRCVDFMTREHLIERKRPPKT